MSKAKWFSIFVKHFDGWGKVAIVRSDGLASLLLPKIQDIYPGEEVKVVPGKDSKMEEELYNPDDLLDICICTDGFADPESECLICGGTGYCSPGDGN